MLITVHMKEDGEIRWLNTDLISEMRRLDRSEPSEGTRVYTVGGPDACVALDVMETGEQIQAMEQLQQLSRQQRQKG